jgi:phosphohistidine phosphatase
MQLLIVRHARAEDRDTFAQTEQADAQRPLTRKGIRKMKCAASGLRLLVSSIDLLVSSSLRRAIQTARILADTYGDIPMIERDELAPGGNHRSLIDWLATQPHSAMICLVGHEPDLSDLLKMILTDPSEQPAKLKKGSATLVQFEGPVTAGTGKLQWHRPAGDLAAGQEQSPR